MATNSYKCGCNLTLHRPCKSHDGVIKRRVQALRHAKPTLRLDYALGYIMASEGFENPTNMSFSYTYCKGWIDWVTEHGLSNHDDLATKYASYPTQELRALEMEVRREIDRREGIARKNHKDQENGNGFKKIKRRFT